MTHRYAIGGVAFLVEDELQGLSTTGFADATLRVRFIDGQEINPGHSPESRVVTGPFDLRGAIDPSARECLLPNLSSVPADRAWQLRQMAPIFSAVLGRLVLHAGAVEVDGRLLAFIGESGVGKSTLVRFLADRGHESVADDLLPVRFTPRPTSPIGDRPSTLDVLSFLSRAQTTTVDLARLSPLEALQELIANGFGEHGDRSAWSFQFDAYHRIAETVPVFSLTMPDDLEAMPEVERAIAGLAETQRVSPVIRDGD